MQKKFITNLALVISLNLLIKPFWILFVDRKVQNMVGPVEFGNYYALLGFTFLLNIMLDLGITNFNNKNIAQHNHLLEKHISSIVSLKLLLALFFFVLTFGIGMIIGYSGIQMRMLIFLTINMFLISFIQYLRSNIAGLHLFKTDSLISVLDRAIMILICGYFLITNSITIRKYILVQTGAYILTAIITFFIVIKKSKLTRLTWNLPFFIIILKKSYPYAILVLLMTFYNRIDTVMIERMLPTLTGAEQAGVYASAYRLLDATNMIAFLFAGLLLPIFARMIKLKEDVEQMVRLAFSLLIVPAIIVGICSYFFRHDIMILLYKNNSISDPIKLEHIIRQSSDVFGLLMSCFVPIASNYIFGTLLTANGNLKQLNIIASIGMAINILLNLFLIPKMFAFGSSVSSLVTQLMVAVAQIIVAQNIFKFKMNYKLIISLLVFVSMVISANLFVQQWNVEWFMRFGVVVGFSFGLAFALRLISVRNIFRIVRYGD